MPRGFWVLCGFCLVLGFAAGRGTTPARAHPTYGISAKERVKAQALVFDDAPALSPCEQLAILEAWTLYERGGLSERQMMELSALISRSAVERKKREGKR